MGRAARLVPRFASLSHFMRARAEAKRLLRHSKRVQPDFCWFQNGIEQTHKINIRPTLADVSSGLLESDSASRPVSPGCSH